MDSEQTLQLGRRLSEQILDPMKEAFVGKDEIIDLLGIALVAGENMFLLGPPGTAKSALIQNLARRLQGEMFDYLLTRFTEPNELFGPFDIRKLRDGELGHQHGRDVARGCVCLPRRTAQCQQRHPEQSVDGAE